MSVAHHNATRLAKEGDFTPYWYLIIISVRPSPSPVNSGQAMNSTLPLQSTTGLPSTARFTAAAALLCGIHCVATPFLVAALPFLAVSKTMEWGALGLTVALGTIVTLLGPTRARPAVIGALTLGALIWAAALAELFEPVPEAVPAALGSLIFAGGMLWSARICRSGECDRCASGAD